MVVALLPACRVGKYLSEDEFLVKRNRIELADGAEVDDWAGKRIELLPRLVTQPNGNFFFFAPREWFYLRNRDRADSSRYLAFVRRVLAEPPALLDSTETARSRERIRGYMLNRGYFDAKVTASVDTIGRHHAVVTYRVDPGRPYRFDTIRYAYPDAAIARLLDARSRERRLAAGQPVDARDYDAEVTRVVNTLRDNGYAEFFGNSVAPLAADSAGQLIDATFRVLPPTDSTQHAQFRIGQVTVFPDDDPLVQSSSLAVDTTYDGLRIIYGEPDIQIEPRTIAENVFLRPGQLFSQSDIAKTNRQLNGLGVFRFVTIRQERSLDQEREIDVYVYLTPDQRWTIGTDQEISLTDRQAVSGGRLSLFGLQLSGSLANNNVRGGAERLDLSADVGVEFNFANLGDPDVQRLNTFELGGQGTYSVPRFIDYFGLYRGLNRLRSGLDEDGEVEHVISDEFYEALREQATTNIELGARYVSLLNFYNTTTLTSRVGYQVPFGATDRYTIHHVGLDYFTVRTQPLFDSILTRTPFLQRSLGDQVFSGFALRDVQYVHAGRADRRRGSWTVFAELEQSGFEAFLANKAVNAAGSHEGAFRLGDSLDYARYVRAAASFAYRVPLAANHELAFRLQTGTANTFGFERLDRDVPYVKQFFAGGSRSLRAWQVRAVGPGSFRDSFALNTPRLARYQQANFKLELNLEYRSFLTDVWTSKLYGAVFVDAGNVWTWRQDPTRPGSQFRLTPLRGSNGEVLRDELGRTVNAMFYEQLAVNTGVGVRFDIGYVLFRLDVGMKLRNPYAVLDNGVLRHWPTSFAADGQNRFGIALDLNYPF